VAVTKRNHTLSALVGDPRLLPILFGLGAIQMAKEPDGLLTVFAARQALRRAARRRSTEFDEIVAAEAALHDAAPVGTLHVEELGAVVADRDERSDTPVVLELRAIRAGYGDVEVLHDIDLVLHAGSVLALLGANGAGKSTLCNVAGGFISPTAGTIWLGGEDVTTSPAHRRARGGLFVAPESRGVFPALTVSDNLALWLPTAAEREEAYEHFPILRDRQNGVAGLLSGGEQQLLALAPALVRPPRILIADEPTLGLAPLAAEQVCATIAELRALGVSVLLIEEKSAEVLQLADEAALMTLGRITWRGPRAALDEERLTASYLGV
jgi:ABC-type branched-subunit amino acid transport system ATPase component